MLKASLLAFVAIMACVMMAMAAPTPQSICKGINQAVAPVALANAAHVVLAPALKNGKNLNDDGYHHDLSHNPPPCCYHHESSCHREPCCHQEPCCYHDECCNEPTCYHIKRTAVYKDGCLLHVWCDSCCNCNGCCY